MRKVMVGLLSAALLLTGCGGGGGGLGLGPRPGDEQVRTPAGTGLETVAAWGDSLTAGSGGDGTSYPSELASLLGVDVYNGGVPGERSAGIAAREGGRPVQVNVVGGSLPASGGVQVKLLDKTVIIRDAGDIAGTIADIHGTMTKDQSKNQGAYTFTRDADGTAVDVPDGTPFIADVSKEYQAALTIIWAGHNDVTLGNGSEVVSNIADMVSYVQGTGNYLVLGLSNGTGGEKGTKFYNEAIETINPALEAAYGPDHYLDIRSWLISDGLAAAGIEPTDQDRQDIANDIPPSSLRYTQDAGHLNATGYTVMAQRVRDFIVEHNLLG